MREIPSPWAPARVKGNGVCGEAAEHFRSRASEVFAGILLYLVPQAGDGGRCTFIDVGSVLMVSFSLQEESLHRWESREGPRKRIPTTLSTEPLS